MEELPEIAFLDLVTIQAADGMARDSCERCCRPCKACWCKFCPDPRIDVETEVFIFQHPHERKRNLRTAPMLEESLQKGSVHVLIGRHFNPRGFEVLKGVPEDPNTILLYPSKDSVPLSSLREAPCSSSAALPSNDDGKVHATTQKQKYKLVLLDGTWMQAKSLYLGTKWLANIKKVHVSSTRTSDYVIHTQPLDMCLSTVEAAALALAELEDRPEIVEPITKPLREMVAIQLRNGAVQHHSKETIVRRANDKSDCESGQTADENATAVFEPSDDVVAKFSKHLKKSCPV